MDIYSTRERIRKENINFMNLPLRVTFYARVSTDFNVQLNSLDNQITYYTDFIRKNPNWEYVDGYVDEGISGVSTAKRERFNEMIEDAKAGMFDLIVTKEVSRFARNTLDRRVEKNLHPCAIRSSAGYQKRDCTRHKQYVRLHQKRRKADD